MINLQVKSEMNAAARRFPQLRAEIRKLTARAINETAAWAKADALRATAKERDLPLRAVRNRLDIRGGIKEDRAKVFTAGESNLQATLRVWMRGIPISQLGNRQVNPWNKPGAKHNKSGGGIKVTQGNRFYEGAFRAKGLVFKRSGTSKFPIFVPKIGLRLTLTKAFNARISGPLGLATFRKRFDGQLRAALGRLGIQ